MQIIPRLLLHIIVTYFNQIQTVYVKSYSDCLTTPYHSQTQAVLVYLIMLRRNNSIYYCQTKSDYNLTQSDTDSPWLIKLKYTQFDYNLQSHIQIVCFILVRHRLSDYDIIDTVFLWVIIVRLRQLDCNILSDILHIIV